MRPDAEESEEEDSLDGVFRTEREKAFYNHGEDMDFVRYHKRTTRNFKESLQRLIDSGKQTVARGIQGDFRISLGHVRLNKSCSVANIFWTLVVPKADHVGASLRQVQSITDKDYIEEERKRRSSELERRLKPGLKDASDVAELNEKASQHERHLFEGLEPRAEALRRAEASDQQILIDRDIEARRVVEAEIQKKLTKAAKFFCGKLTTSLGLRFAPDLRFHLDNSESQLDEVRKQAERQLAEHHEREQELERQ